MHGNFFHFLAHILTPCLLDPIQFHQYHKYRYFLTHTHFMYTYNEPNNTRFTDGCLPLCRHTAMTA